MAANKKTEGIPPITANMTKWQKARALKREKRYAIQSKK